MSLTATSLPEDLAAAHAMILAERTARRAAEARAEAAEAQISGARFEIEPLKLLLAKARRGQYGQSSDAVIGPGCNAARWGLEEAPIAWFRVLPRRQVFDTPKDSPRKAVTGELDLSP
jgi:hypothetical protein